MGFSFESAVMDHDPLYRISSLELNKKRQGPQEDLKSKQALWPVGNGWLDPFHGAFPRMALSPKADFPVS